MKPQYSDEVLINGLRQRNQRHITYIYHEFTPVVRHLVSQNSGSQSDVEDLVQETMMILYNQCIKDTFHLDCSLKTFFMAISKNLWLQRLERKYRLYYQADFSVHEPQVDYNSEEADLKEENEEKLRLFHKHIDLLPADCRRLLELYFLKIHYKEIARLMNLKDEVSVKMRKYACKNLLRKKILNDPEYRQFFDYEIPENYQ